MIDDGAVNATRRGMSILLNLLQDNPSKNSAIGNTPVHMLKESLIPPMTIAAELVCTKEEKVEQAKLILYACKVLRQWSLQASPSFAQWTNETVHGRVIHFWQWLCEKRPSNTICRNRLLCGKHAARLTPKIINASLKNLCVLIIAVHAYGVNLKFTTLAAMHDSPQHALTVLPLVRLICDKMNPAGWTPTDLLSANLTNFLDETRKKLKNFGAWSENHVAAMLRQHQEVTNQTCRGMFYPYLRILSLLIPGIPGMVEKDDTWNVDPTERGKLEKDIGPYITNMWRGKQPAQFY